MAMQKRRHYFMPLAVLLLVCCFSIVLIDGTENSAEVKSKTGAKYIARLGHVYSTADPYYHGALKFKERVQSKSNGQMKIQSYHAGQLGDAEALFQMAAPFNWEW